MVHQLAGTLAVQSKHTFQSEQTWLGKPYLWCVIQALVLCLGSIPAVARL